jgi:hypothetical protein
MSRLKSGDVTIAVRRSAFRSEEGRAELVRRWLAGESEGDIGRSLGYTRRGGAATRAVIRRFVNGQLPERGYRLRCEREQAREALSRYAAGVGEK